MEGVGISPLVASYPLNRRTPLGTRRIERLRWTDGFPPPPQGRAGSTVCRSTDALARQRRGSCWSSRLLSTASRPLPAGHLPLARGSCPSGSERSVEGDVGSASRSCREQETVLVGRGVGGEGAALPACGWSLCATPVPWGKEGACWQPPSSSVGEERVFPLLGEIPVRGSSFTPCVMLPRAQARMRQRHGPAGDSV